MTALIMPGDYGAEMLLGTSPVLGSGFLGSPNQAFFGDYSRFTSLWRQQEPTESSEPPVYTSSSKNCGSSFNSSIISAVSVSDSFNRNRSFRRRGSSRKSKTEDLSIRQNCKENSLLLPLKPCIILRQDEQEKGLTSPAFPTREKKKVTFADMEGKILTYIREITEGRDCPPRWTSDFIEKVTGDLSTEVNADQWQIAFSQPACDYLKWKAHLEKDLIALENVVIKNPENVVEGLIKVRNIAYHKQVLIRYTTNNWVSHDDVEATYLSHSSDEASSAYSLYDGFSFSLPLPTPGVTDKLEFCLSYKTAGQEFWDNNDGKNYVILSLKSKICPTQKNKPQDLYDVVIDSWSEFASWNHLSLDDSPYW